MRQRGDKRSDHHAREREIARALALLLALGAALPLWLGPGIVNTRAGGDSPFLLLRVYELAANLRSGMIPARWMPHAAYGFGYPAFHYYASLPYYLAAILDLLGAGVIRGLQLTQTLLFLLAAGAMFNLAERLGFRPWSALVASAAYTMAPFHLVNVYVRGDALSEFCAMALFPLVLSQALSLAQKPSLGQAGRLGLVYAALILSHNISALVASPILVLWFLWLGSVPSEGRGRRMALFALALLLGLGISAWFWLPALSERYLVQLGEQTSGYFHYAGHFRSRDLIQWRLIHDYTIQKGQDPFSMGLLQAIFACVGSVAALVLARRGHARRWYGAVWAILAGTTLLITPLSRWVWDHAPLLPYVQFPWRLLGTQALATALMTPLILDLLPKRWRWGTAWVLVAVLTWAALGGLSPSRLPIGEKDITPQRFMLYETFSGNIGGTVRYEYLPKEMVPRPYVSAEQIGDRPEAPLILNGAVAYAERQSQEPGRERWRIAVKESARLAFPRTAFSGWQVMVDGHRRSWTPLPGLGLIGLELSTGTHEVTLSFEGTPFWRLCEVVSLAMAAVAAGLWGAAFLRQRGWQKSLLRASVVAAALIMLAVIVPPAPAVTGPLFMDFRLMPYLHPEPQGVKMGTATLVDYALSRALLRPGDSLTLETVWRNAPADAEVRVELYGVTAHLFPDTLPWLDQRVPLKGSVCRQVLDLPTDLPPGLYVLRVRLYVGGDDAPLRTTQGEKLARLVLEPIQVVGHRFVMAQGEAKGYFGPPGASPVISLWEVTPELRDKRSVEMRITFRCERQAPLNYYLSVVAVSVQGQVRVARDLPPLLGGYPTSLWLPGEWITDRVLLEVPGDVEISQLAAVEVVLYDRYTMAAAGAARVPLIRQEGS